MRLISNMHLICLDQEGHDRTCDYWYCIRTGALAHTAFNSKQALLRWLSERNLTIDGELPAERGTHAIFQIVGQYREQMHGEFNENPERRYEMSPGAFYSVAGELTKVMSNGDYTLGIISTDEDGIRTVHSLNPNVRTRVVFDRKSVQQH